MAMRSRPTLSGLSLVTSLLGLRILGILLGTSFPAMAQTDAARVLADDYQRGIKPILTEFCVKCHSTEKHKGDLDLEQLTGISEARRNAKIWQGVAEQLGLGEMPPKDKPQPTPTQRAYLLDWIDRLLELEALAQAGDPGPVVLRRLSNAEYTYTVQDLTGVKLQPAREFPADGAAGEGFMNTGNSLVMSPSLLTKYLDAAKEIASHAVLVPDGMRFSPGSTPRDWTDESLAALRKFYLRYSNAEGQIPLEQYLAATLEARQAGPADPGETLRKLAFARKLNEKYLQMIWTLLNSTDPSIPLGPLLARWRTLNPEDAPALAADFARWQKALWAFKTVGWMKKWMEPVNPVVTRQDFRLKLPQTTNQSDLTVYLLATDAGDGAAQDYVVWEDPRLVAPGRPEVRLRDLRGLGQEWTSRRGRIFGAVSNVLEILAEGQVKRGTPDWASLAASRGTDMAVLGPWLDYLGLRSGNRPRITHYLTNTLASVGGHSFVQGWGSTNAPYLIANASSNMVRVPGTVKARGLTVYPSAKLQCAVGWSSPVGDTVRVEGSITPANPECGNGVTWALELRRGTTRQKLAGGIATGRQPIPIGPFDSLALSEGDLLSLLIGPRDGDNGCDYTSVDLQVKAQRNSRLWSLETDLAPTVLAGNPHADAQGSPGVWHIYTEPTAGGDDTGPILPTGSLLAKWQTEADPSSRRQLAGQLQQILSGAAPVPTGGPDLALYRELTSFGGPVFVEQLATRNQTDNQQPLATSSTPAESWGLDPGQFGRHPSGRTLDPSSLCVTAPSLLAVRLPAELVNGYELVTTAVLQTDSNTEGSVQVQLVAQKATLPPPEAIPNLPILVKDSSERHRQIERELEQFRLSFPPAICYRQIVPVDEAVTLTLFHREDDHLIRLMLNPEERVQLDRLWEELHFVSQSALRQVDAYEQIMEFTTQDRPDLTVAFRPFRQPFLEQAAAFRRLLVEREPRQLESVLEFAARAYRRPLGTGESQELHTLYQELRRQEIPHPEAIRLTLAKILVAPAFLYRLEKSPAGNKSAPVSNWELASRLSYFLWASQPDEELLQAATRGDLANPDALASQARRMLKDPKVRRLAIEFGCQWLHVHDFDQLDEKSERHFPMFRELRGAMYEETIRFFTDLFQNDRSVLATLDADYVFVNESLAKHYGIPGVKGTGWERVDGVRKFGRGGILGLATTLSKQAGASRTSPILRGNWVSETLLGEKLPRPPKNVPVLPEDEAAETLTVRQLVERHSSDPKCSGCHLRIDGYGFALEGFDAIGRAREKDLGDRPIDTAAKLLDGTELRGMEGMRDYLLNKRRPTYLKQFSRKLLGYALGRGVQLSDNPLLQEMRDRLQANEFRISTAVETIVRSRQFREIRGQDMLAEDRR